MNAGFRSFIAAALLAAAPVFAANPSGKPARSMPSVRLRHLIDNALAKMGSITNPKQVINRTPLTAAQSEFTAMAQTAPPEKQPLYQAVLVVLANLTGAVGEHEKAVANFTYSKSLHGPQDTKDEDISNVRHGYSNNAKQNKENADSRKALQEKEQLFLNGATSAWARRFGQLRDIVEQSYTAELVIEKQLAMAAPPAPTPVSKTASKEASASAQGSPVGSWKPTKSGPRPLNLKGDNTAIGGKFNGTWKWADQSKGSLNITWNDGLTMDLTVSPDGRTLSGKSSRGLSLSYSRGN